VIIKMGCVPVLLAAVLSGAVFAAEQKIRLKVPRVT
jgi:hypothetical protein